MWTVGLTVEIKLRTNNFSGVVWTEKNLKPDENTLHYSRKIKLNSMAFVLY